MANQFSVSPMSQRIELKSGETYNGSILVANSIESTEDFYFKISVSPYNVEGVEYTPDFLTMTDRSRIVDWIELDTKTGRLEPNEVKEIHFSIKVPEDAPSGGQYAMIGVSSDNTATNSNTAVKDVFEMASLIFATVDGETRHDGRILDMQVPGFVASGNPVISTTLTNNGNVHETATIAITVKNHITGETVYPKDAENMAFETIVMPETTRLFTRELNGLPALGIFEVVQNVDYLDVDLSSSTIMVICPIWFIVLVVATIASVISMVCYGRHLKHKKAAKNTASDFSD
ncbi:hypothetical protein IKF23_01755 [Candidatus Saccharibacteria bacterium]|nr:hypothetical protein [Candidatus Saccharibacteria bacterium]